MSGLGGLNPSEHGVVIGLVQLQLPVTETPADLARQTARVVELVGKARRNNAKMDLVVFPEYMLHGLIMDVNPEIMCDLDGPEVAAFKAACVAGVAACSAAWAAASATPPAGAAASRAACVALPSR